MTATRAQKAVEAAAFRRATRSASASSSASVTKAGVTKAKTARKTPVTAAAATSEVEEAILDSITVSTGPSEPSTLGSDRSSPVVDEEPKPIYPGVLPVYDDISQVVRTRVVRDANGRPSIRHRRICAYKNREGKTMIVIFAPPKGAPLPKEEGALEAPRSPSNETGPWGDPYCDYAGH
ncbi:hypothetical protein CPLU01_01286 [Colletotrichum plurivorum]|uniref:Uncharacterized protein n=1 Tax=Colletotrichum plurivorum TaxID=2175906 RepID=A0A8H6NPN8_9PEZI|nr:hypothetical protein CPLU01_01286 [Colletotrichum plurivorum]